jgi:predicted transposase YdaD
MSGPHDLLVRYTFSHPERAEAELRAVLPARLVAAVDWSSLRQEPGSVVDEELRETESDLLFSARLRTGREVLVYVLLEHQSTVDRWMAQRMLRYVQRQGERWREEHPESTRLPVIIPLVMYHGTGGEWTAPRRVEELYDVPEEERELWRRLVPRFEYLLDDLTAEREEALRARAGPALVRLTWLMLHHGRTEELAERLPEWATLFAEVYAAPDGTENLGRVVRYLLHVGGREARAAAGQVLHSVMDAQRAEELMKSYGEELIEQGRQQGLQQGLQQGREEGRAQERAESVLRILAARGVSVGHEARQRILACTDVALLAHWFERALSATTLSDVLDDQAH